MIRPIMSVSLPARNHTSDLTMATLFPQRAAATSQSLYLKQETSDPETFHSRLFITSTENNNSWKQLVVQIKVFITFSFAQPKAKLYISWNFSEQEEHLHICQPTTTFIKPNHKNRIEKWLYQICLLRSSLSSERMNDSFSCNFLMESTLPSEKIRY